MKRGHTRRLALAVGVIAAIVVASSAAWIGSQRATASSGAVATPQAGGSGILRIGTVNYIDSFNPWNYIEGQGLNAMVMTYPVLAQIDYTKAKGYYIVRDWAKSWKTSKDGKTWTFKLFPNTKWSDGQAMTAADAAWTINTTIKYQERGDWRAGVGGQPHKASVRAEQHDRRRQVRRAGRECALAPRRNTDRAEAPMGATREEAKAGGALRRIARRTSSRWSRVGRTR